MSKWLWRTVVPSLLLGILIGCGGGGSDGSASGGGGGGGGGGLITDAARTAAIAGVELKLEELYANSSLTDPQIDAQLAAYMQSKPEFSNVRVSADGGVTAFFPDGRPYLVVNNRLPHWFRPTKAPSYQPESMSRATAVVTPTRARLFHSFGKDFEQVQDPVEEMSAWLSSAGYTIANPAEGDARLATLRNVSGDGFFYFNTHGGSLEFSSTDKTYGVGSSTLRSEDMDNLPENKADLDAKRILYMTAPNGDRKTILGISVPKVDTRYAISHRFVDQYWNFGENAIVFMNSCWSAYTAVPHGAQAFMDSVKKKGAGVYLGWTAKAVSPGSEDVPRFFVDRLAMANRYKPEDPKQRPFFVNEVMADMRKKGMIPFAGADLIASYDKSATNIGLRPTIEYVQMFEPQDELHVHGEFGGKEGEVFVDGTKAQVINWGEKMINVRIPSVGAGSYGAVVVKSNGKESNPRALTMWTGTYSYTEESGEGKLKCTFSGTIKFRADLDKRRTEMGTAPKLDIPVPFWAAPGSTCSFTASGEIRDGAGKIVEKWSGSGTPPLVWEPVIGARNAWTANGAYNGETGEFALGIYCGGPRKIQDHNGTHDTGAGAFPLLSILQQPSFLIPGHSESGSVRFSVSNLTPSSAPSDQKF